MALAVCAAARADGPAAGSLCVQVEGADRSAYLNCINAELAQQSAQAQARAQSLQGVVQDAAPASPAQAGLVTEAATRERLGTNFGHRVRPPQAPPPGK